MLIHDFSKVAWSFQLSLKTFGFKTHKKMSQVFLENRFEFEKPFPCHLCGFVGFQEKRELVDHLMEYHNFQESEIASSVVDFLIAKLKNENEGVFSREIPPRNRNGVQEIPKIEEPTGTVYVIDEWPAAMEIQDNSFNVEVNDSGLLAKAGMLTKSVNVKLEDFVKNLPFSEGDLIVAKMGRWSWWPAVILKCRKINSIFQYKEPHFGVNGNVLEFNVNFFGGKKMSTAWLPEKKIYKMNLLDELPGDSKDLKEAIGWAKYLSYLTNDERVEFFNGDLKCA